LLIFDATAKSPKNVAKTTPMLQNQGGKELLTLASSLPQFFIIVPKVGVKIDKIAFRYSGSQKITACSVTEKNTLFRGGGFYFFYFSGIIDFR